MTLRVPGSSPGAPTNKINQLWLSPLERTSPGNALGNGLLVETTRQRIRRGERVQGGSRRLAKGARKTPWRLR